MSRIKELIEKKQTAELMVEDMHIFVDEILKSKSDKDIVSLVSCMQKYGMSDEEIYSLAGALAASGMSLNTSRELGYCVDSQSVGKFSDPINLIVMSVLSVYDIKFVKAVGNSYAEKGSTFDRLKSIKGLKIPAVLDDAYEIADNVGVMLFDAKNIAPAAVKLYNICKKHNMLVEFIIAATVVANKIATGSSLVIYDIKIGEGSVLGLIESELLAQRLINVSSLARINAVSVITDLSWPISATVGYNFEIQEIIDYLSGAKEYPNSSLKTLAKEMTVCALMSSGVAKSRTNAVELYNDAITSGKAYQKFREILEYYGANFDDFNRTNKFVDTAVSYVVAKQDGYVFDIKLLDLYNCAHEIIGSGKSYDKNAGIVLMCAEGTPVKKGQKLAEVFFSLDNKRYFEKYKDLNDCFAVSEKKPVVNNLFYKVMV